MYYQIDLTSFPEITRIYSVIRRTVWQIVDPDNILLFIADGHCKIEIDRREYLAEKGDMLFIPARTHYIRTPIQSDFCTLYYAHFRLKNEVRSMTESEALSVLSERIRHMSPIFSEQPIPDSHHHLINEKTSLFKNSDQILTLYQHGIQAKLKNHMESPSFLSLYISEILLTAVKENLTQLLSKKNHIELVLPKTSQKVRKTVSYIHLHYKENISLDDLCAVCNYSKQHLIRIFKSETGMTPNAYIQKYRINCAKELLAKNTRNTDRNLSVKEIANELGFEDPGYFNRLFKKETGQSPHTFMRNVVKKNPYGSPE